MARQNASNKRTRECKSDDEGKNALEFVTEHVEAETKAGPRSRRRTSTDTSVSESNHVITDSNERSSTRNGRVQADLAHHDPPALADPPSHRPPSPDPPGAAPAARDGSAGAIAPAAASSPSETHHLRLDCSARPPPSDGSCCDGSGSAHSDGLCAISPNGTLLGGFGRPTPLGGAGAGDPHSGVMEELSALIGGGGGSSPPVRHLSSDSQVGPAGPDGDGFPAIANIAPLLWG
jgi:hypothetical protein